MLAALRIIANPGVTKPQQLVTLGALTGVAVRLRQGLDTLRGWLDRRFFREAVNTEKVLHELGEKVRSIVEVQPLLATVTSTISNALHVPRVAMMMLQNGDFVPAYALGYAVPRPLVKFSAKDGGPEAGKIARAVACFRNRGRNRGWITTSRRWAQS